MRRQAVKIKELTARIAEMKDGNRDEVEEGDEDEGFAEVRRSDGKRGRAAKDPGEDGGRGGGQVEGMLAAMCAGLGEVVRELKVLRGAQHERAPTRPGKAEAEGYEKMSFADVAGRPSLWVKVLWEKAGDEASRVDGLMMALERYYKTEELKGDEIPAQASARALEAIRPILSEAVQRPGDAERLGQALVPLARILYANRLIVTHSRETAVRWQAAVADKGGVDEGFSRALSELPPGLRKTKAEREEEERRKVVHAPPWADRGYQPQRQWPPAAAAWAGGRGFGYGWCHSGGGGRGQGGGPPHGGAGQRGSGSGVGGGGMGSPPASVPRRG